ncbi:aspartic peptidase domain-containing protein [Trichoderma velutinum]
MPAVFSLPVDYHPVSQAKLQNRNLSPTLQADTILYDTTPIVKVSVGTPPQPIGLAVDLQMGYIAFLVPNITKCTPSSEATSAQYGCAADEYCALMGYFCPATSSTMKSIQPSKSDPEGPVNADVVTVGSQKVDSVHMWLNDINPGEYSRMGIAPGSPFLDQMVDQGLINSPSFSLWSDASRNNQGHLLFGGVNKAMYEGKLQAFPLSGKNNNVNVPIAAVVVESGGSSTASPTTTRHDLADSTTAVLSTTDIFTFLPNKTVQQIYADLDITPVFIPSFNASMGIIDCARPRSENRTVSLVFGSAKVSVPWSALFQPFDDNTCEFMIVPYRPDLTFGPGSELQIGSALLQYMYLAVDYDNMFAAVAPLNPNPGPDNILEIGNGTRIPDADGDFPATITPYGAPTATQTTSTGPLPASTTASKAQAVTIAPRVMDLPMFFREFEDPLAKHILTQYPNSSSSNQFAPTPSINRAQWRALQSDVDKILNDYASSPVQDQDDTPEVLRAFLKYLCEGAKTLLMQEIKQFNEKSALRQLRNFLVDSILKSMLIAGGKQPKSLTPSPIVIPGLTPEESQVELRSDQTAIKRACLARDNHRCVFTGMIEQAFFKSIPPQTRGGLWSSKTECAHIIPFALSKLNPNSTQEAETKAHVWWAIYRYFPFVVGKIGPENINAPENAITLRSEAHVEFAAHRIAAEPTNTEHKYRVHDLGTVFTVARDLSETITMTQSDPAVVMPDPELLRLHYQVSMIVHESGIRERYERIVCDNEDSLVENIQSDGSTDLGNILSSKMLTDI